VAGLTRRPRRRDPVGRVQLPGADRAGQLWLPRKTRPNGHVQQRSHALVL